MASKEVEQKRKLSEKIAPEIQKLIKQHGYEAVNYTWQKTVQAQREIAKAEAEVAEAQRKVESLKRRAAED